MSDRIFQLADRVTAQRGMMSGSPVVANRRISTELIEGRFLTGESVLDMAEDFDLEPADIEAALRYESCVEERSAVLGLTLMRFLTRSRTRLVISTVPAVSTIAARFPLRDLSLFAGRYRDWASGEGWAGNLSWRGRRSSLRRRR